MKKILKTLLKTIVILLGLIILYLLFGYFIPFIEVPAKETSAPKTVDIYILTNGVHTDLVVPIKSRETDWSKEILFENTRSQKTNFKYLSVGWGDKGFYLDTPTWAELKFSTAFKAAFGLSNSAMHCTFYNEMTENKNCVKIPITQEQYSDLVKYIREKFYQDENGNIQLIKTDAVYGNDDAFYDAKGRYNFLETCNTWANSGLKAAGQKAALWTPSDFGIFRHYK
ncbi:MAG: TIGR02117 family protein [Flavobacteriaceae bacterium]|jgi:uncharacterized protein (TIGR02117 family)|nr:TIGR02117 family protein [Flavobacteriaceae bacterium]